MTRKGLWTALAMSATRPTKIELIVVDPFVWAKDARSHDFSAACRTMGFSTCDSSTKLQVWCAVHTFIQKESSRLKIPLEIQKAHIHKRKKNTVVDLQTCIDEFTTTT